jgi:hypothetical protein
MANELRVTYDGFSDTGKHSVEWVRITKKFLKLAFAGGCREASCPCNRCENKRILLEYEMSAHQCHRTLYLLWYQHEEVQLVVANESDENDDVDRMPGMVADIGRGYDLESEDPPPEVQNFYKLLAALEEKVYDGTDVTMLQVVTHPMSFKSKYSFSNQCYNDIVKLIIDIYAYFQLLPS